MQEVFMLIKEVMKDKPEVINCERSIEEAAKMMEKGNFGGIPVERNDKMIGMITDRDIVVRCVAIAKTLEAPASLIVCQKESATAMRTRKSQRWLVKWPLSNTAVFRL
jgi:predicted transcriptional regulator